MTCIVAQNMVYHYECNHVYLKKMWMQIFSIVSYKNSFKVIDRAFQIFYDFSYILSSYSIITVGKVLKSPTGIVELLIFPFNSFHFYFMYFETLSLSSYTFMIMLSWWTDPFTNIKCHSLSLKMFSVFNSTLSVFNIDNPVFLCLLFA